MITGMVQTGILYQQEVRCRTSEATTPAGRPPATTLEEKLKSEDEGPQNKDINHAEEERLYTLQHWSHNRPP